VVNPMTRVIAQPVRINAQPIHWGINPFLHSANTTNAKTYAGINIHKVGSLNAMRGFYTTARANPTAARSPRPDAGGSLLGEPVRTATAQSPLAASSQLLQLFNGYWRPRFRERAQQQAADLHRLESTNLVKLIKAELHAQQRDAARHWLYLICPMTNTVENDVRRLMAQLPK
jgi:hypothetical protein